MKGNQHATALYMEMLSLTAVFVMVILLITQVFALAKEKSSEAKALSDAVCLAENTAELVACADSPDELLSLMGGEEKAQWVDSAFPHTLRAECGGEPFSAKSEDFFVEVTWEEQSEIRVYWKDEKSPVYTLKTAAPACEEAAS